MYCWLWLRRWKWGSAGEAGKELGQTWLFLWLLFQSATPNQNRWDYEPTATILKRKNCTCQIPGEVKSPNLQAALILKYIHSSVLKHCRGVPNTLWKIFTSLAWEQWTVQYSKERSLLYVCHNSSSGPGRQDSGSTFQPATHPNWVKYMAGVETLLTVCPISIIRQNVSN